MALIKLKALEETRSFYNVELKKKGLTETERDKYLKALKIVEKIIKGKENPDKKMSKNLEKFKKICKERTKDYFPANVHKEKSLIKILEGFEKRIKKLEKHNLDNNKFVAHDTYFPHKDKKKVLE